MFCPLRLFQQEGDENKWEEVVIDSWKGEVGSICLFLLLAH